MQNVNTKVKLTETLKVEIEKARFEIQKELHENINLEAELFPLFRKSTGANRDLLANQLENVRKRIFELESLLKNPFFAKVFYFVSSENDYKERYISKYAFFELGISSWVAPVASLRFEDLGETTFKFEDGHRKKVILNEKDSYIINSEKLIYFSKENQNNGVQVIYEDFFSNAKTEFGLSEIISKIEKEQYKIIQSDINFPLIISGPAGSGKTTICLHRVAYLMQSPETENKLAEYKMLMLVQDNSSKEYFASLLPKLGINRMDIFTFFEWAKTILNLPKIIEIDILNMSDDYLELLEIKTEILHKIKNTKFTGNNFINQLEKIYEKNLSDVNFKIFKENSKNLKYDYLDLCLMLYMLFDKDGFYKKEKYNKSVSVDKIKTFTRKTKIEYSLIIVDEFQNYSEDEISILNLCLSENSKSINYIGDLNQQNIFKPKIKKNDLNFFNNCKKVHLSKVYRNTKQILNYIKNLGYEIEVAENARNGEGVVEIKIIENELINILKIELEKLEEKLTIGILCDNFKIKVFIENNLAEFLKNKKLNFRILTKKESQGTEFNTAIVINGNLNEIVIEDLNNEKEKFQEIKKNIQKNNDYVGYTRAVEKLVVIKI